MSPRECLKCEIVRLYQVVGVCEEELKVAQRWNGPGILNLIQTLPMYDPLLTVVTVLIL